MARQPKIVEDDLDGNERIRWISMSARSNKWVTNNIRQSEHGIERLPSRASVGVPGVSTPDDAQNLTNRDWYIMALSPAGNVAAYTLTSGSPELAASKPWERGSLEVWRRQKMRISAFIEWHGDCLATQVMKGETRRGALLTAKKLPATPCAPNPSGPCACKLAEQAARRALHERKMAAIEESHQRKATQAEVELAERSAKASAEAMAAALAPVLEHLNGKGKRSRKDD